jgi:two-component system, response regulator
MGDESMSEYDCEDILLVEDNPTDIELTMRAIRKNKLANPVVVAEDGSVALDYLHCRGAYAGRNPACIPKVILLDLKLPKVDGLEVLKAIKADERLRVIPVVALTSSREEQDIVASYHLGVNSYIVKPIDFDKFVNAVCQVGLYWLVLNLCPR